MEFEIEAARAARDAGAEVLQFGQSIPPRSLGLDQRVHRGIFPLWPGEMFSLSVYEERSGAGPHGQAVGSVGLEA